MSELALASPAEVGLDEAVLAGLAPQFEGWGEANLHAALILRHGKLVYERYFAGDGWNWATHQRRRAEVRSEGLAACNFIHS